MVAPNPQFARTSSLEIAYEESGPADGAPVLLMHGWPYDPRDYDGVVPLLTEAGCRVIVPYLRGFGPTRFLSAETPRSGQQAALAKDLIGLMDALGIGRAALAGYDWGGRAACIAAALWPDRVRCLLTGAGYNLQDIPASVRPAEPAQEHRYWYQFYFHTERGRTGLTQNRRDLCKFIWQLWSPHWSFDEARFEQTASSFDNPDFVAVTIQSYRHRYGYAEGDPAFDAIERQLAAQPRISVPTVNLHGEADGIQPPGMSAGHARFFTGFYKRILLPRVGHNVPQEVPVEFAGAMLELLKRTAG